MTGSLRALLESALVPALEPLLDPLHRVLDQLPPGAWRALVCLYLLAGTLWTLGLSRRFIYRGAPSASRLCDLRIWVAAILLPYLVIYLVL